MKRKRNFRRRRSRKGTRKGMKVARVSTVKRMISRNEETKWTSSTFSQSTAYDSPPIPYNLVGFITKGTARNNRDGNVITLKMLKMGISIVAGGTAAPVASRIRLMVILHKDFSGTAPSGTFVGFDPAFLFSVQTIGSGTYAAPLNPQWVPKVYKVLYDKSWSLSVEDGAAGAGTREERIIRKNIYLKDVKVQYNDSTFGDNRDVTKNCLYFFAISDETVATGPPTIFLSWSLTYKDA